MKPPQDQATTLANQVQETGDTPIPVQPLVTLIVIAAGAGVLAAVLPARRAGRLNVLDAIAA